MRQVSKWVTIFKVINSPSGCQRDFEHWIDLWPRDVKWMQDKLTVVYILAAGDRSQTIRARVPLPRPRPSPKRNSLSWPSHSGCNWSEVKGSQLYGLWAINEIATQTHVKDPHLVATWSLAMACDAINLAGLLIGRPSPGP